MSVLACFRNVMHHIYNWFLPTVPFPTFHFAWTCLSVSEFPCIRLVFRISFVVLAMRTFSQLTNFLQLYLFLLLISELSWIRLVFRISVGRVMSHIWTSDEKVTHMNKVIWTTYERVMSHIWMSHVLVTHMKESCHTHEGVMKKAHIWTSHVTHMKESCKSHIHEGVMSHIWKSHVIHMNESCHTFEGVM